MKRTKEAPALCDGLILSYSGPDDVSWPPSIFYLATTFFFFLFVVVVFDAAVNHN